MADRPNLTDVEIRAMREAWQGEEKFSRRDIEYIADERAKLIVSEMLKSIGLNVSEKQSETAAMIEGWKTTSKGIKAFIVSVIASVAASLGGLVFYLLTGHKQ